MVVSSSDLDKWLMRVGTVMDVFQRSVRMSTYIVAVAVGRFDSLETLTSSGTKVAIYAPPEQIQDGHFALEFTKAALEFFNDYFAIDYAISKLDQLAVVEFSAGAMENWGLVTYRDSLLLYNEMWSTALSQQRIASVICHELAHQISMFYTDNVMSALNLDGLHSTHAVWNPAKDPAAIGSIFDAIAYQKGASIINMLHQMIGPDAFRDSMRVYLAKFQFANAVGDDLWRTIEGHMDGAGTAPNRTLSSVMTAWITHVGYPLVTAELHRESGTVRLKQRRFAYLQRVRDKIDNDTVWPIKLTYKTNRGEGTKWLLEKEGEIKVGEPNQIDYVFINDGGNGFYRTMYDTSTYEKLTHAYDGQLTSDDRASLLCDTFALVTSGELKVAFAFDMLDALKDQLKDTRSDDIMHFGLWTVALEFVAKVYSLLEYSEFRPQYKRYMWTLVGPLYARAGAWQPVDDMTQRRLQAAIVEHACNIDLPECLRDAQTHFQKWRSDQTSVAADLRPVAVREGVRRGNDTDWQLVWERYLDAQLPSVKTDYLDALATTTDAATMHTLLNRAVRHENISAPIMAVVFRSAASSTLGRHIAWQTVRANWRQLHTQLHQSMLLGNLLSGIILEFTDPFEKFEATTFLKGKELGKSKSRVAQALEMIDVNIQWRLKNQNDLKQWLNSHNPAS